MARYRWLIIIGVLGLAAAWVGCRAGYLGTVFDRTGVLVSDLLARDQQDSRLTASGTIQADEIRIASELGGRIASVAVKPGDRIGTGDLMVRLDDTALQARLLEAEAAIIVAQAKLEQVRAGPRADEIAAARAALLLARAKRDGLKAAWQNALNAQQNPQELDGRISEAQTKVKLAEQGVALAEAQLAKEKLVRDQRREGTIERDIADWQFRAAQENVSVATADLEAARALLNSLWAIRNRPLALIVQAHLADGQHQVAEAGVAVAQAQLEDLLAGPTTAEIAIAAGTVRLERAKADAIRARQARFTLTSPVDGLVLEHILRPGELAAPAATILTVADLSELMAIVYVPADRVGHVQLGQPVQIEVDSFPDRTFAGRVSRIGDEPEYTPRNITTVEERLNTFYAVQIVVQNPEGLLKPGMPADATY